MSSGDGISSLLELLAAESDEEINCNDSRYQAKVPLGEPGLDVHISVSLSPSFNGPELKTITK
jgi:hypothetical protein